MLVYLSDADSTDVTDTEVRFSLSEGGGFPDGTAIPDGADGFSGYGASLYVPEAQLEEAKDLLASRPVEDEETEEHA